MLSQRLSRSVFTVGSALALSAQLSVAESLSSPSPPATVDGASSPSNTPDNKEETEGVEKSNRELAPASDSEQALPSKIGSMDDDEFWELKAKGCPFCNFMLRGPCRREFMLWDICVEKSKAAGEVFEVTCMDLTGDMMKCMSSNPEYYNPKDFGLEKGKQSESGKENSK